MDIFLNGEKVTITPGRGSKPGARMTVSYELLTELAGMAGCAPHIVCYAPDKTRTRLEPGKRIQLVEGMNISAIITGCA
jgi:hypothetical protein